MAKEKYRREVESVLAKYLFGASEVRRFPKKVEFAVSDSPLEGSEFDYDLDGYPVPKYTEDPSYVIEVIEKCREKGVFLEVSAHVGKYEVRALDVNGHEFRDSISVRSSLPFAVAESASAALKELKVLGKLI